jgi:hypothetical protein
MNLSGLGTKANTTSEKKNSKQPKKRMKRKTDNEQAQTKLDDAEKNYGVREPTYRNPTFAFRNLTPYVLKTPYSKSREPGQ